MFKLFKKKEPTYESELKDLDKEYPDRELSHKYCLLKNDLDFKYNKIDSYTHDKNQIKIMSVNMKDIDVQVDYLKCELKHNKIDSLEYEKRYNDLYKKPWAKIHFSYNEDTDPTNMQTEVVYNDYFIKRLKEQGYSGETNESIIQTWLSQVFASNVEEGDIIQNEQTENTNFVKTQVVEGKKIVG